MIGNILNSIINTITSVIGKLVPDKNLAKQLETEIRLKLLDEAPALIREELLSKKEVLLAEIGGESWMQRNWRPVLMLVIVAIVANNYILAPYLGAMFNFGLALDLPEPLWNLMQIGVGGYIAGRTGEKMLTTWKTGKE